jgi:hypothetical protein
VLQRAGSGADKRAVKDYAAKLTGQLAELTGMVGLSLWWSTRPGIAMPHAFAFATAFFNRLFTGAHLKRQPADVCCLVQNLDPSQVRGELSPEARRKVNTLVITDVHGRDIVDAFVRDSVVDAREFAWESQLRFYWDRGLVGARRPSLNPRPGVWLCVLGALTPVNAAGCLGPRSRAHCIGIEPQPLALHCRSPFHWPQDDLTVRQCTGLFRFGYEYMGLNGRLVITALTDRCGLNCFSCLTEQG